MADKIYMDISHHHPITNWDKVEAQCPFIITKATQGTDFVDSTMDSIIRECESRKIPYWLYTFLNSGDELEQTKYMIYKTADKIGKMFVGYILDVEMGNSVSGVKSALDYLNTRGTKTMLYVNYRDYEKYKSVIESRPSNCAWWECRYGQNIGRYQQNYPPHNGADFHQFTDKGVVDGVRGNIDLNRICGAKSEDWFKNPKITIDEIEKVEETFEMKMRVLKKGCKGKDVESYQQMLAGYGYYTAKIDGEYGTKTVAATKKAQKDFGIKQDGEAGAITFGKFFPN